MAYRTGIHDHYMRFVGYDKCNQLIWTNEINRSQKETLPMSNNTQSFLGFINNVHIDICDIVKEDDTKKWFFRIKSLLVKDH